MLPRQRIAVPSVLVVFVALALTSCTTGTSMQASGPLRVVSEKTVTGFVHPEAVTYDPRAKVLYVSEFGSELRPTQKDGKGRISRVSLTGEVLDKQFLPAPGGVLNKPKGSWVAGNRLWVSDIDAVWVFDLTSRKGRKVDLPGIKFANDVAVRGTQLFISDNAGDQLYMVEPADFLEQSGEPKVTVVFSGKTVNPNGIYPARDGSLLMVGFTAPENPRGIYAISGGGEVQTLAKELGRLDGLSQMADGSLLITDWRSGSLIRWSEKTGVETLAKGLKGPADFGIVPESDGLLVVIPDLVASELRLVKLAR